MDQLQHPAPLLEVLAGTIGLVVIIIVHGAGIRTINGRFNRSWAKLPRRAGYWRVNLLLTVAIGALTLLHLVETLMWAVPIHLLGIDPEPARQLLLRAGMLHHPGRRQRLAAAETGG